MISSKSYSQYYQFVQSLATRYPRLEYLATFLGAQEPGYDFGRAAVVNIKCDGSSVASVFYNFESLQSFVMSDNSDKELVSQLLLIEDLTPQSINLLGTAFKVDLRLVAHHLRHPRANLGGSSTGLPPALPSADQTTQHFCVEYIQTLVFHKNTEDKAPIRLRCQSNVVRKIAITGVSDSMFIGHLRRCFTVTEVTRLNNSPLILVFLDPPAGSQFFLEDRLADHQAVRHKYVSQLSPFNGGYTDISDFPQELLYSSLSDVGPPRTALLDDLLYYWTQNQNKNMPTSDILSACAIPFRIAANEWVCTLNSLQYLTELFERPIEGEQPVEAVYTQLSALQKCKRRCAIFSGNLTATISLLSRLSGDAPNNDFLKDFNHLQSRLHALNTRIDSAIPIVTAIIQISDARWSLKETENIKRMTYLALVYVPLSFCTGFFGMNSNIVPQKAILWTFFLVSVPLIAVTLAVALGWRKCREFITRFMAH